MNAQVNVDIPNLQLTGYIHSPFLLPMKFYPARQEISIFDLYIIVPSVLSMIWSLLRRSFII